MDRPERLKRYAPMHACCICPDSREETQHDCCAHHEDFRWLLARIAALEEQNARLRALGTEIAEDLGDEIGCGYERIEDDTDHCSICMNIAAWKRLLASTPTLPKER